MPYHPTYPSPFLLLVAPSGSSIHLTLLEDEEYYNDRYTYWNDVYGFKMLTMQSPLFNEAGVDVVDGSGIISDSPCCLRVSQGEDGRRMVHCNLLFITKTLPCSLFIHFT